MLKTIISDGQNGVSLAVLRAARNCKLKTAGFMPQGFTTTGSTRLCPLPERASEFQLIELPDATLPPEHNFEARCARLAQCSFYFAFVSPGDFSDVSPIHRGEWPSYYHYTDGGIGMRLTSHGRSHMKSKARQKLDALPAIVARYDRVYIHGSLDADEAKAQAWFEELFSRALTLSPADIGPIVVPWYRREIPDREIKGALDLPKVPAVPLPLFTEESEGVSNG